MERYGIRINQAGSIGKKSETETLKLSLYKIEGI